MTRAVSTLALLASLVTSLPAFAHSWLTQCTIAFDDDFALSWNYAQARGTFAPHTGLSPQGEPQVCDPDTHLFCWTYRERCGSRGYVNVQEYPIGKYNHIHLMFEDDSLGPPNGCFASSDDGLGVGYGSGSAAACTPANWAEEPRFAAAHLEKHFVRMWIEDRVSQEPRIFDVASIRILEPADAEVWYRKADGGWWYWPRLRPGVWNLSAWAWEITGLYVRAADGEGTAVQFDDVVVRN